MLTGMFSSKRSAVIWVGLVLFMMPGLSASLPPPLTEYDPENPPEGLFSEDWMEVRIVGSKVGYSVTRMSREGDEITTIISSYMKIGRGPMEAEIKTEERYRETLDGRPLAIERDISMARQPIRTQGRYRDGILKMTLESPGYLHDIEVPLSDEVLFPWGMVLETYRQGLEPGTSYAMKTYLPDLRFDGPVTMTVAIGEPEEIELEGVVQTLIPVEVMSVSDDRTIPSQLLITETGRVVKNSVTLVGMPIDMILVSKAEALADFISSELIGPTLIRLDTPIPEDARQVVYQIHGATDLLMRRMPDYLGQRLERLDESNLLVTVTGKSAQVLPDVTILPMPPDYESLVSSNLMINSDDPVVMAMAYEAVPEEEEIDPAELATRLRDYVSKVVTVKSMDIGFATASEVARNREGDCSEHAVLLAALGRVHGLPSRVAAGLIYTPDFLGQRHVMGYHLWTQFFYNQQWWDYDSAMVETDDKPYRIALFTSALDDQAMLDFGLDLAEILGRIQVEVVRID